MSTKQPLSPDAAMERAFALCARAEHCSAEILAKLRAWGVTQQNAFKILDELKSRRYVDDTRFANAFGRHQAVHNRWGKRKIELALRQKQIDPSTIREALEQIEGQFLIDNLTALLKSKIRTGINIDNPKGKARLMRFAIARGFSYDEFKSALNALNDEND